MQKKKIIKSKPTLKEMSFSEGSKDVNLSKIKTFGKDIEIEKAVGVLFRNNLFKWDKYYSRYAMHVDKDWRIIK